MTLKLKAIHGAVEIRGLGIRLTQESTEEEIKRALKHAPQLSQFIDGATKPNKSDGKTSSS